MKGCPNSGGFLTRKFSLFSVRINENLITANVTGLGWSLGLGLGGLDKIYDTDMVLNSEERFWCTFKDI